MSNLTDTLSLGELQAMADTQDSFADLRRLNITHEQWLEEVRAAISRKMGVA